MALILCAAPAARPGTWSIGILDSSGDVGRFCKLRIDGDGDLHAVYLRYDLGMIKIVSRISDVWQTPDTIVPAAAGGHCGLALSQTGEKRISYYRSDLGSLGYAGPEVVDAWSLGPVTSSPDNVGLSMSTVRHPAGGLSLTCRNTTAGSLLLLTRDELGTWSSPQTIDPGPNRALTSDHAYHTGVGYAFSEYASDGGMLLFADTTLHADSWQIGAVTASADDVGLSMSTVRHPAGGLSLTCRNTTAGSLLLLTRDELGTWSSPQTIDPGPNRALTSDHAYHTGVGYAFSEYASDGGMLLFADTTLHADSWMVGTVYGSLYSGTYPSAVRAPDGRIASAFYHYDEMAEGQLYISALHSSGYAAVKAVDDTIGNDENEAVCIDLALTPEWDWHLSYRNGLDNHLWYAFSDAYVVTGVDDQGDPGRRLPSALTLRQSYPNPFNPTAVIEYAVPASGMVGLCVYDAGGRLVRTLVHGVKPAGAYTVTWNGRNDRDARVASGVYFIRLSQGGAAQTRKMILMR